MAVPSERGQNTDLANEDIYLKPEEESFTLPTLELKSCAFETELLCHPKANKTSTWQVLELEKSREKECLIHESNQIGCE